MLIVFGILAFADHLHAQNLYNTLQESEKPKSIIGPLLNVSSYQLAVIICHMYLSWLNNSSIHFWICFFFCWCCARVLGFSNLWPDFNLPQLCLSFARIAVRTKTWSLLLCEAASTHLRPCWCCTAGRQEWLLLLAVPPRGPGALLWALPQGVPRQVPQTARRARGGLVLSGVWGTRPGVCIVLDECSDFIFKFKVAILNC